jgi:hypothetical protein
VKALGGGVPSSSPAATTADAAAPETSTDDSASADDGAPPYPAGPYGAAVGKTFPLVTWQGEHDGAAPIVSISSADYYDPSGSKGIRGVFLTINALNCGGARGPCDTAGKDTESAFAGPPYDFKARGGRAVDILVQNWTNAGPQRATTIADLATWVGTNGITYDVVIDPALVVDGGMAGLSRRASARSTPCRQGLPSTPGR